MNRFQIAQNRARAFFQLPEARTDDAHHYPACRAVPAGHLDKRGGRHHPGIKAVSGVKVGLSNAQAGFDAGRVQQHVIALHRRVNVVQRRQHIGPSGGGDTVLGVNRHHPQVGMTLSNERIQLCNLSGGIAEDSGRNALLDGGEGLGQYSVHCADFSGNLG
ncbi:MAG: hypothetical protein CAPSK01_004014 [Candidatus Accumulibacter vicinus]|uniref:Uncharacterized protein n=1 Tax=Candidatus Accumulibacter vicinus TaxID=2954382 RepID=A0A084XW05_9PROT|nr:MAG: hypothetical protein CAPSK01_004014 [Candidatus Accumulibacter vicinus]